MINLRKFIVRDRWGSWLLAGAMVLGAGQSASAQGIVPGTGYRAQGYGDDFEDTKWEYQFNLPKASRNIDKDSRLPAGQSLNGHVYESSLRGQPDIIRRVPTPKGGLKGSTGALLIQSKATGVPGVPSYQMQQDDLIINPASQLGGSIPIAWGPSLVVRVWMPPFEHWEGRTGSHFGIRADVEGMVWSDKDDDDEERGFFRRRKKHHGPRRKRDSYWPGYFVQFNKATKAGEKDSAVVVVRCDERGQDFVGPTITKTGWWTFGMSWTPDGSTHYYVKQGVENLTAKDHIASNRPYNADPERVTTWFFNSVNMDDGKTWSTAFIVDDPQLFYSSQR